MRCLLAFESLQDSYLENLHPHFFAMVTVSFMISLTGSVINSVKWCTTSEEFSTAGIYCFGLETFMAFSVMMASLWYNHSRFPRCSLGLFVHSVDNPFHRVPYVMSIIKSPYNPPSRGCIRDVFGDKPLWRLEVLNLLGSEWPGALSIIKRISKGSSLLERYFLTPGTKHQYN